MRAVKRVLVTCALMIASVACATAASVLPAGAGGARVACDCDRGYYGTGHDDRYTDYYGRDDDYGFYPSRYSGYDGYGGRGYRHTVCDPDGDRCYRTSGRYWKDREYHRRLRDSYDAYGDSWDD